MNATGACEAVKAGRAAGGRRSATRRWQRPLAAALAVLLTLLLGGPGSLAASTPTPEPPAAAPDADATTTEAGSFQLGKVRILGIPALTVASPALAGEGSGPDARERARVIEGNLALLVQPRSLCTPGEALAETFVRWFLRPEATSVCRDNRLGLGGPPRALRVEAVPLAGGPVLLQARLQGRLRPLPLLTVTAADARLHGTTPALLAARWRAVLEERLQLARQVLQPAAVVQRWKRVAALELGLLLLLALVIAAWRRSRRRLSSTAEPERNDRRLRLRTALSLLLLATAVLLLVMIAGVATFAVPGEVPLAIDLLLQPFHALIKLALVSAAALALHLLSQALLSQWAARMTLPAPRRARRQQRYRSLRLMSRRLIRLGALLALVLWVVVDLPGVRRLSASAVLASGALLGALAIVFQGLLRDFVAGLVTILDDRFAIGDTVDLGGAVGEVIDIGVLSTELRTPDQRVVSVANSRCDTVVNHTKLQSGAELTLPLAPQALDLPRTLAVLAEETAAFAAEPPWQALLLAPPQLRGVSEVTPQGVIVSVLVSTAAGRQGEVRRALLARLLQRLSREGIALASAS